VWYPPGSFGHFINAILTLHGKNFVRPTNQLVFSETGDSHSLDLVVPKYSRDHWPAGVEFLDNKNYCVLVDNGLYNEGDKFKSIFTNSTVVKICYNNFSWPVFARTVIDKAMGSSIEDQLLLESNWDTDAPWARREKYFLFLRDHALRNAWKSTTDDFIFYINDLFIYSRLFDVLNSVVEVEPFEDLWQEWRKSNALYIDSIETADAVIKYVLSNQSHDLTHIKDIWTQAIVYYYIWLEFRIEVPHNDFADFFSNTKQIIELVA
jgi:hypothetical protein